ncbi:alpha/beta fold hydrolase [Shimia sp. NS0008-38b]|uniref:alpha/beta hydrolase n=1 Tax=Shimia sp. NS0008-38b TaxID=3127653 RepID=UPI00333F7C82
MSDSSLSAIPLRKQPLPQLKQLAALATLRGHMWVMSRTAPDRAAARLATLFTTPPRPQVRPWERAAMAQARYTRVRFEAFGFLSVYRWGATSQSHRPKVLLMHGFGGRVSQLSGIAQALASAGYEVVAFDAPAHGQSGTGQAALPDFVDALEIFAAQEGAFEAVVAHSMGAAAVMTALRRGMAARRAVLIAPPSYPGSYLGQIGRTLGATEQVIGRTQALIETRYGRAFDEFRTPLNATALTQPGLILHDVGDRQVPVEDGRAIAQAWRNARLEVTEGLGHTRILRATHTVSEIQNFVMTAL